jgi:glucokinase
MEVVGPITLPSNAQELMLRPDTIVPGFGRAMQQSPEPPADCPAGITGDLRNLPALRGGVPLGQMLEEKFRLPVFID